MAVCAIVTGERVPSWITPEPSSMDSVRATRYPSTEGASAPQASATQQTSRPSFSASTANSTVFLPAAPSTVVAVRITVCITGRIAVCITGRITGPVRPAP